VSSNTNRENKPEPPSFKFSRPKVTERPKTAQSLKMLPGLKSPTSTTTGFNTLKQSTMDMTQRSNLKFLSNISPSNKDLMESVSRGKSPDNEHRNFDFLTSMEFMLDQEYDQFNNKNLNEEENHKKKTPRYFNSGLEGRTLTRIQSAAPRTMQKSSHGNRIVPRSAAL